MRFVSAILLVFVFQSLGFAAEDIETEASVQELASQSEATTTAEAPTVPERPKQKNPLGLSFVVENFDYEEPNLMGQRGLLPGIGATYFLNVGSRYMMRLDLHHVFGSANYQGGISGDGGTQTYASKDQFSITEASGIFVIPSHLTKSFVTAPYFGFGYRITRDGKDNQYDYRREITYPYLRYGLQFDVVNTEYRQILIMAEINTLIGGSAKTHLSDVNSRFNDVDLEFQGGTAYKLGFEAYFQNEPKSKIMVGLSYKYWDVPQSKVAVSGSRYFIEPKNNTKLTTLTTGYFF